MLECTSLMIIKLIEKGLNQTRNEQYVLLIEKEKLVKTLLIDITSIKIYIPLHEKLDLLMFANAANMKQIQVCTHSKYGIPYLLMR